MLEEDLVVAGAAAGEDALVFLVHEAHLDPELPAPHLLDGLGDEVATVDVAVRFRDPDGPKVLLCTEVGGEGLAEVARDTPDYLDWCLGKDFERGLANLKKAAEAR